MATMIFDTFFVQTQFLLMTADLRLLYYINLAFTDKKLTYCHDNLINQSTPSFADKELTDGHNNGTNNVEILRQRGSNEAMGGVALQWVAWG